MIKVCPITAEQARPLRHQVLRSHLPYDTTKYPTDDAPDSFHAGAFNNEELIGIASVARQIIPIEADSFANKNFWQLRGMAVLPSQQGQGVGKQLVLACVAHIAQYGNAILWCNGRTSALKFYQALNFQTIGGEFESSNGTGPHYVMWRNL